MIFDASKSSKFKFLYKIWKIFQLAGVTLVDQKLSILIGAQLVTAALVKNNVAFNDEVVASVCKLVKEEGHETIREHAFNVLRHMVPLSSSNAVKSVVVIVKVSWAQCPPGIKVRLGSVPDLVDLGSLLLHRFQIFLNIFGQGGRGGKSLRKAS